MTAAGREGRHHLFVGTYTDDGASEGIYTVRFDEDGGRMRVLHAGAHAPNPSHLALRGEALYAAHEMPQRGCLAAYAVDDSGALACRGACSSPGESGTCFVAVHPNGRRLYGANYLSGSVSCCAVLPDGRTVASLPATHHEGCGPNRQRQESPHVHSLSFVPGTGLLVAVDLGADALVAYRADEAGARGLAPAETVHVPAGSGPRMLAFHPHLPIAALVNELACDLLLLSFDGEGLHWRQIARLQLPAQDGALAAHVAFADGGRRLYASVRGIDRIAAFELDGAGLVRGRREDFPSGGRGPRHFSLSPDERFLAAANQDSGEVAVFARDAASGALREAASIAIPRPSCVIWAS